MDEYDELSFKIERIIEQNKELLEDNIQLREQIWLLLAELRRQAQKL